MKKLQTHALHINGCSQTVQSPAQTLLVEVLRDELKLTGTHIGCDTGQCGACTVLMNGKAVKSCNVMLMQVGDKSVTTIESLAVNGQLNPMQHAFTEHHALQCGYCTSGFVMRAMSLVDEDIPATPEAVRHALGGNICRCTGYEGIVKAICQGLTELRGQR